MTILAMDSSGMVCSAALWRDGIILAEYTLNNKMTHSQTLLPMIDEIMRMTAVKPEELDAVAVAAGPGSFTGLRIGSATAKGIGLALDLPLIPVPTVEALAYNLYGTRGVICPIMDARRQQVYTGIYRFDGDRMETLMDQAAMGVPELAELLNHDRYLPDAEALQSARADILSDRLKAPDRREETAPVIFLGDGVPVYRELLESILKVPHLFAPAHLSRQRAGAVASLAALYAGRGESVTAAEHVPVYLRPSQAEREKAARQKRQEQTAAGEEKSGAAVTGSGEPAHSGGRS